MTALDWILLALLAVSVGVGLWRGLVFEILSIVGWFVAYFAAPHVSPYIAQWLPEQRLSPATLQVCAFLLAFLLVLLVWSLGAKLVRLLIQATPLSLIDRVGGAGFGVLRGLLFALLVVLLVGLTPVRETPPWQDSVLAPPLLALLQGIKPVLPDSLVKFIPA
ncbi:CvpA family protein [Pelomonas sp. SE-A7]|uniref:CvpA family protein n=1 Tax=Pelomonas sp. SE-A7 TaxID=3054953 RepID=UPI00259CE584|nr:CvpA family protein [Pelomonas sp. SE-A7]MDM4765013.1 CvpA family protein [Pelomonas sp. SE-A7]